MQVQMTDEASDRNIVLNFAYERIPAYALWTPGDIARESIVHRKKWWTTFQAHEDYTIKTTVSYWIIRLHEEESATLQGG
tara:strand:- start:567 stop:806 length:240 start_codon:yes stop_codon:yes gene_type:complete